MNLHLAIAESLPSPSTDIASKFPHTNFYYDDLATANHIGAGFVQRILEQCSEELLSHGNYDEEPFVVDFEEPSFDDPNSLHCTFHAMWEADGSDLAIAAFRVAFAYGEEHLGEIFILAPAYS